jgi:hypothetical protein
MPAVLAVVDTTGSSNEYIKPVRALLGVYALPMPTSVASSNV